jgi:hypothetical protein
VFVHLGHSLNWEHAAVGKDLALHEKVGSVVTLEATADNLDPKNTTDVLVTRYGLPVLHLLIRLVQSGRLGAPKSKVDKRIINSQQKGVLDVLLWQDNLIFACIS